MSDGFVRLDARRRAARLRVSDPTTEVKQPLLTHGAEDGYGTSATEEKPEPPPRPALSQSELDTELRELTKSRGEITQTYEKRYPTHKYFVPPESKEVNEELNAKLKKNFDKILHNVLSREGLDGPGNGEIYLEIFDTALQNDDIVLANYMSILAPEEKSEALQEKLYTHDESPLVDFSRDDPKELEKIINKQNIDINAQDEHGMRLLNHAIKAGAEKCVEALLKKGACEEPELRNATLKERLLNKIFLIRSALLGALSGGAVGLTLLLLSSPGIGWMILAGYFLAVGGLGILMLSFRHIEDCIVSRKVLVNPEQSIACNLFGNNLPFDTVAKIYAHLIKHLKNKEGKSCDVQLVSEFDPSTRRLKETVLEFQKYLYETYKDMRNPPEPYNIRSVNYLRYGLWSKFITDRFDIF